MNIIEELQLNAVVHTPIKKYPIVFFDLKVSYEGSFDKAQVDILSNAASICEHNQEQLEVHVLNLTREEADCVTGCYQITDFDSENHIANIRWAEWFSDFDRYEPVDDDETPTDTTAVGLACRRVQKRKVTHSRNDDYDYRESY